MALCTFVGVCNLYIARSQEDEIRNSHQNETGILNGANPVFFSNELFKTRPVIIIQDSDFYSDGHSKSHFFRERAVTHVD